MGSNPTRTALFSFRRKKELFGLVALHFFLFIGLRVFMYMNKGSLFTLNFYYEIVFTAMATKEIEEKNMPKAITSTKSRKIWEKIYLGNIRTWFI